MPLPKPPWLKKRIAYSESMADVTRLLRTRSLHTVCEEAHCPNIGECFGRRTATFLILGDICTRACRFCAVRHGYPLALDPVEPENVAEAAKILGLEHVVVTSVTRDDLPDGGALQYARTLRAIREAVPGVAVEVLIPDFRGSREALATVLCADPSVLNHNVETVPRLYPAVRPQADYRRSLGVLSEARTLAPSVVTKSGLMLGLGEEEEEVLETLQDLLDAGCGLLTLGQYLAPSLKHHPVVRYIPPETFSLWQERAEAMGFSAVASGPFVRSSFHAHELYRRSVGSPRCGGLP